MRERRLAQAPARFGNGQVGDRVDLLSLSLSAAVRAPCQRTSGAAPEAFAAPLGGAGVLLVEAVACVEDISRAPGVAGFEGLARAVRAHRPSWCAQGLERRRDVRAKRSRRRAAGLRRLPGAVRARRADETPSRCALTRLSRWPFASWTARDHHGHRDELQGPSHPGARGGARAPRAAASRNRRRAQWSVQWLWFPAHHQMPRTMPLRVRKRRRSSSSASCIAIRSAPFGCPAVADSQECRLALDRRARCANIADSQGSRGQARPDPARLLLGHPRRQRDPDRDDQGERRLGAVREAHLPRPVARDPPRQPVRSLALGKVDSSA